MAQIFHRSTNVIAKVSILGAVFIIGGVGWIASAINRSSYVTQVNVVREQPVPFSHRHHVGQLGIDCRYCHTSVEQSSFAGIPPTETCMTCHSQIHANSPMLQPVRESWRTGKPLPWVRVHDLPEFVYFNHSIHLKKGIGCVTCHGQVEQMALMWQVNTLNMEWCLQCHREPEKFVRPRDQVFNSTWQPPNGDQLAIGQKLVKEYNIQKLTDCSVCHR
ncbi:MAG: cytochrome c3 family protein [Acidobacteriota bacterium]|nr:cytochrome c family protein [Blastocatellia bacterium]MDW8238573.1 cytochrome c3 family protein [Acidobacteriota bacterium]